MFSKKFLRPFASPSRVGVPHPQRWGSPVKFCVNAGEKFFAKNFCDCVPIFQALFYVAEVCRQFVELFLLFEALVLLPKYPKLFCIPPQLVHNPSSLPEQKKHN